MIRLIRRYESRKLYDTEESRYVSLEEVAAFVRGGQQVMVVESATDEDVTAQTLAQVILEEGRSGRRRWSPEILHELLRRGERTLSSGVEQVQNGVDRLIRRSLERLEPVRQARDEMERLRARLDQLEEKLARVEDGEAARVGSVAPGARRRAPSGGTGARKPARTKAAAGKRTPARTGGEPGARTPRRKTTTKKPRAGEGSER
ncbi:MAG TPA: polyhydroxyalkanoate synthesis regulator DNA-binding domain-containing protein [Thermoanaerobaculia bacterium]|nr:polyhydroxyalkanoate synthesis regulator DNA-binding domain-containing protein [Thermoanaerobaculia bacterium]